MPDPAVSPASPASPAGGPPVSTVEQHLARILGQIAPLPDLEQPLMDALGVACTQDVVAGVSLPSFDNSSMDGYAVHLADVLTATAEAPVHLPVVGAIGAGQADLRTLPLGTAAKIMTGAPVPAGCDTVVPYEWTDRGATSVEIRQAPGAGQHIRGAGEDVMQGDLVVESGTRLGPRHIGLLASVGRATVRARQRPRVVIVSTGSELRDPGTPLGHDSIYDGNSFLLAAAARRAGAIAFRVGIVPDEPQAFLDALEDQLSRADVVVTSGGVSQGDYDVVKAALTPRGVWFGPVAMQPGRPQGFGVLGERRTPIFNLPGNPVSSYISFELFVVPALRTMMGLTPVSRPTSRARLTHAVSSPAGKRQFLRGELGHDAGGAFVSPAGGAGSHLVGDLAGANCLIIVGEDTTSVPAGERVQVSMLDGDF